MEPILTSEIETREEGYRGWPLRLQLELLPFDAPSRTLISDGNRGISPETAPNYLPGAVARRAFRVAYAHLTVTGISRGRARSALGMVTVRMPLAELASILSGSTVVGSANVRSKVP